MDRRIMNMENDDQELEIFGPIKTPNLYNLKKEIKVDSNNFGIKSYKDNCKKEKRNKEEAIIKANPLIQKYPCLKR